jgi:hypothetical protein
MITTVHTTSIVKSPAVDMAGLRVLVDGNRSNIIHNKNLPLLQGKSNDVCSGNDTARTFALRDDEIANDFDSRVRIRYVIDT